MRSSLEVRCRSGGSSRSRVVPLCRHLAFTWPCYRCLVACEHVGAARRGQYFPPSRPTMPYSNSPLAPVTALASCTQLSYRSVRLCVIWIK
ncbi:hypothetical protein J6590_004702 [Homalodisca vitripennis]|nr:hypothetical protein J6590_004702 [Homalodisca vitripennis]